MRKTKNIAFYRLFPGVTMRVNNVQTISHVIGVGVFTFLDGNFSTICGHCVRYLHNNYGHNIYVVFDGYKTDGTNSLKRTRRSKKKSSNDIIFDKNMPLKIG